MIADAGEFFDVDSCIEKGIIGRVKVLLDGVYVRMARERITGSDGYVITCNDPPSVDRKNECVIEHKIFGDVRVEIADE